MEIFSRTRLLIGDEGMERLSSARVAIFGLGGVGGYVAEALARSGVKHFFLVDNDVVSVTNINRQIIATQNTVGRDKCDVMKERLFEINPGIDAETRKCFFMPENSDGFDFSAFDYVIDAIDTVTAKIELIICAQSAGVPVISCMGAGNRLDPCAFRVGDIYQTKTCPLACVMRRELKKRGVRSLKVVYSLEEPVRPLTQENKSESDEGAPRKDVPGSVCFAPSVAGLILASEVIKDIAFCREYIAHPPGMEQGERAE